MKKLNIAVLLLSTILCFGLLSGCAVKGKPENIKMDIQKYEYNNTSSLNIEFSVKAKKSLCKITCSIDIIDKYGRLIATETATNTYAPKDSKVNKGLFTFNKLLTEQSYNAVKVVINNLKCYYDNNWIYGVCFGSAGIAAIILLISYFIKITIKDKKNAESIQ